MTLSAITPCQATGMLTTASTLFFFFLIYFYLFWSHPIPQPEIKPVCFTAEVQSLSCWTTGEVPFCFLLESPQHFLSNALFL